MRLRFLSLAGIFWAGVSFGSHEIEHRPYSEQNLSLETIVSDVLNNQIFPSLDLTSTARAIRLSRKINENSKSPWSVRETIKIEHYESLIQVLQLHQDHAGSDFKVNKVVRNLILPDEFTWDQNEIQYIRTYFPSLNSVRMHGLRTSVDPDQQMVLLGSLDQIKTIELRRYFSFGRSKKDLSSKGIRALPRFLEHLTLQDMGEVLGKNNAIYDLPKTLKSLSLENCLYITPKMIQNLSLYPELTVLKLENHTRSQYDVQELVSALPRQIVHLSLKDSKSLSMIDTLRHLPSNLQSLDLSGIRIRPYRRSTPPADESISVIEAFGQINRLKDLKTLNLSNLDDIVYGFDLSGLNAVEELFLDHLNIEIDNCFSVKLPPHLKVLSLRHSIFFHNHSRFESQFFPYPLVYETLTKERPNLQIYL